MKKSQLQSGASLAGLACGAVGIGFVVASMWIVAVIVFCCGAACHAAAAQIADQRRERIGQAVIRKTREFEEHGRAYAAMAKARDERTDLEVYAAVEQTAINFRKATTDIIRDA